MQWNDNEHCTVETWRHANYLDFALQYMCDCGSAQCTLPVASNAQNGALGEEGIYSHFATLAGDAQAAVPVRGKSMVSTVSGQEATSKLD